MNPYEPQFLSPQGRGRPADREDLPLEINSFVDGDNLYFDSMSGQGNCYFAINTRSNGRTLEKRLGREIVGTGDDSGKVLLLGSLNRANDTDIQIRIISTATQVQVQSRTTAAGDWSNLGAAFGNVASQVYFSGVSTVIEGVERFYFTNGVDNLRYTEGTTINAVADGAEDVIGKYITVVENVLVLGGLKDDFTENQLVYSKAGTHQFRRDVDINYSDSSQLITLDGEITGTVPFGYLVYIFTRSEGLWELDLRTGVARRISTHGTMAPRSIGVGSDLMMWADQTNIWGMAMGGSIEMLGDPVQNLYLQLDAENITELNGTITPDGFYKLWIGDITFENETYTDMCLVYEIERSRIANQKIWRKDTNIPSGCWGRWTNEFGFEASFMGHKEETNVFLMDVGYSDVEEGIRLDWRSKDFPITREKNEYTNQDFYFKLKPDNAQDIDIGLFARANMGAPTAPSTWGTLVKEFTLGDDNTVDMKMVRISGAKGLKGRTLGIRIVVDNSLPFCLYELMETHNVGEAEILLT